MKTYATISTMAFLRIADDHLYVPGGRIVEASGTAWQLNNPHGLDPDPIPGTEKIVSYIGFNEQVEAAALEALQAGCTERQRWALCYSGFIIEHLYLSPKETPSAQQTSNEEKTPSLKQVNQAAALCRLLIRYWEDRRSIDDRAERALPMLWRSYWQALRSLSEVQLEKLPPGWSEILNEELTRARRNWQTVCLLDTYNWFFAGWFYDWMYQQHPNLTCISDWHKVREDEVSALVQHDTSMILIKITVLREQTTIPELRYELDQTLQYLAKLTKQTTSQKGEILQRLYYSRSDMQYALHKVTMIEYNNLNTLINQWHLPRYDLKSARILHRFLSIIKFQQYNTISQLTFGTSRLYAGVVIGLIATMLQSDTWRTLKALAEERPGWGSVVGLSLMLLALLYLTQGIVRKVGKQGWYRALRLWAFGELFGLIATSIVTIVFSPLLLTLPPQDTLSPWTMVWIVLIYTQITLFIGIFTQLLFSEKPTTVLLDAP